MTKLHSVLLASTATVLAGLAMTVPASAADQVLSGSIASAAGQKLDGVLVSAKREGSTITTSVYTDSTGSYYFPPMQAGKYNVWAQALGFEQTKAAVASYFNPVKLIDRNSSRKGLEDIGDGPNSLGSETEKPQSPDAKQGNESKRAEPLSQ